MNRRALLRKVGTAGSVGLLGSIAGCAGGGSSGGGSSGGGSSGGGSTTTITGNTTTGNMGNMTTTSEENMTGNMTTTSEENMTGNMTTTGSGSMNAGATVTVSSNEEYGNILVDSDGFSLYRFEPDGKGNSTCQGKCANVWPPLTQTTPMKGSGVAATIGTITRKDGSKQVTVDRYPLYRYKPDTQPGNTKGQGIKGFGGEWYLVAPDGAKVEEKEGMEGSGGTNTTTSGSGY